MNALIGFVQLLFWACLGLVAILSCGAALLFGLLAAIGWLAWKAITGGKNEMRLK